MRAKFGGAVQDLGKRLGVDGLALDPNGSISVQLDETEVLMAYIERADAVQFYTVLGGMPEEPSVQFLQILLAGNNGGAGTNGAAIGYDVDDETVTLNLRVPVQAIDGGSLERILEAFVNSAEMWRANFADLERVERSQGGDDDPAPSLGSWLRA